MGDRWQVGVRSVIDAVPSPYPETPERVIEDVLIDAGSKQFVQVSGMRVHLIAQMIATALSEAGYLGA